MNQIYDPPNNYDFGLDFDYSVWTAGTVVDLINVPWNNDYRDVVRFANKAARDSWMDNQAISGTKIEHLSYIKANEPIRVNIPFNRAIKYNYIRVTNPMQPIPGGDELRAFFYFILDARYIAPGTTELVLQLDVFQTYIYDVEFGNCFVERGHIGIANEHQFDAFGRDHLTTPEGLDLGNEYVIANRVTEKIIGFDASVIAISTVDLTADPGTVSDPALESAPGSIVQSIPSGATYYFWKTIPQFKAWMNSKKSVPWITQGVVSAFMVPNLENWGVSSWNTDESPNLLSYVGAFKDSTLATDWRDSSAISSKIPSKYHHLKKLWTYPYMYVEATMWSATPIIIKPESWQNDDADFRLTFSVSMPGAKITGFPMNYNSWTVGAGQPDEDFNMATQMTNLPQIGIVNDMAMSYLASNRATISYQRNSADWSQQRALGSAQAQYDIASGAISTAQRATDINIGADQAQVAIANELARMQAVVNSATGTLGGGLHGSMAGPAGAGIGAAGGAISQIGSNINTGLSINASQASLATRNTQAQSAVENQNRQSALMRDTNKSLADWAARGDYANTIAGINAKVQDVQMTQPSMSGQMGGETHLVATSHSEIAMTVKMLTPNVRDMICDFWLRYGYAINRFITNIPTTMMVMEKFTYWKLKETYFKSANIPEGFKQTIRGIFEKGVTVYSTPTYIGTVDIADNAPLTGISY